MGTRINAREIVARSVKRTEEALRKEKDRLAPAIAAVSDAIEARTRIANRFAALDADGLIATDEMRSALERQLRAADERLARAMRAALKQIEAG